MSVQEVAFFLLQIVLTLFKYISCVGSRLSHPLIGAYYFEFKYISCVGSRDGVPTNVVLDRRFKYISCVGSR